MNTLNRNEILEMLAAGTITATEAINLLDNPGKNPPTTQLPEEDIVDHKATEVPNPPIKNDSDIDILKSNELAPDPFQIKITQDDLQVTKVNGQKPRWLKIRVGNMTTGKGKVNVSLPLGLVSFGLGIARRFGAEFGDEENVYEMWQMVKDGERGVLVDVRDEEDNEHVLIYLD